MTGHVDWRKEFEARLDTLRGMAVTRLCRERESNDGDDAVAEAIALCWDRWLRAIAKGRDPRAFSTILARQCIAAAREGLLLCGGNRLTDVLSPAARCHRGYHVEHLDVSAASANGPLSRAFLTGPGADPGNAARAHLDWLDWSGRLCPRLYAVLCELVDGATVREIARRRGWTREYAHRVRTRLARAWQAYGVDCE